MLPYQPGKFQIDIKQTKVSSQVRFVLTEQSLFAIEGTVLGFFSLISPCGWRCVHSTRRNSKSAGFLILPLRYVRESCTTNFCHLEIWNTNFLIRLSDILAAEQVVLTAWNKVRRVTGCLGGQQEKRRLVWNDNNAVIYTFSLLFFSWTHIFYYY